MIRQHSFAIPPHEQPASGCHLGTGVFTSHLDSVLVIDAVLMDPVTLVTFDPADPPVASIPFWVWPGDVYTYLYDEYGWLQILSWFLQPIISQ